MTQDDKLARVEEHLAEILDGDAPEELYDLIAESDELRDLRYDAERAAELARDAGVDYEPPRDLEAELLAALDGRPGERALDDARVPSRTEPCCESEARLTPEADASAPLVPVPNPESPLPKKAKEKSFWPPRRLGVGRRGLLGGIGVLGAAAAALVFWGARGPLRQGAGYGGAVVRVVGGDQGALEACDANGQRCRKLGPGDAVKAGSLVRTDARTRAQLRLEDGTEVALDRMTRLVLSSKRKREARLDAGMILAEVARDSSQTARFEVPVGAVEVLGTKFALRASSDWASVDVSRGEVKLVDQQQRSVAVRAGEEGRIDRGVPPRAATTGQLGESMAWGESALGEPESEVTARGLGELRAKKPGQQQERERAVTLTSHTVKVRIAGSVARTEVDEVFTNQTGEVLEGIYRFPMPPDAKIERLALEVDGKLEEGAFVDRERAAAIWRGAIVNAAPETKPQVKDEIIWVPGPWRDPALLEWQRGGRFELRIYPIPKNGSRRVVLAYTQTLQPVGGVRRYTYPLAYDPSGSTRVGDFRVDIEVRGHDAAFGVRSRGYELGRGSGGAAVEKLGFAEKGFAPAGDLGLEYTLPDRGSDLTVWAYRPSPESTQAAKPPESAAPYVALALRPKLPRSESSGRRAYALVVDSSRSMFGESYQRATQVVTRIVRELGDDDRFTVLACDTTCRALPGGLRSPGAEGAGAARLFLAGVVPEGASDLAQAIRAGAAAAGQDSGRALRVVYVGDGTPTVGPIRPAYLTRAVESALGRGRGTVVALAVGADSDLDSLRAVARGGGGVVLPFTPGQTTAEAAYAALGASLGQVLREVRVRLPEGLSEVAPEEVDTIAAGSESIVVARMSRPEVSGTVVLSGKVGDQPFEQRYPVEVKATSSAGNAFVPRLYAATRIADLEQKTDADSKRRALELSTQFNVASRHTSLLVLESEAMIKAFGLTNRRTAPAYTGEETAEETGAVAEAAEGEVASRFGAGHGRLGGAVRAGAAGPGLLFSEAEKTIPEKKSAAEADDFEARTRDASSKPQPAPKSARAVCAPNDPLCSDAGQALPAPAAAARPPASPARVRASSLRRWIPMRRVWNRVGDFSTSRVAPKAASAEAIAAAERELAQNDQRRSAVKKLYTLYALSGDLERARSLAERWSEKEPLDPEALTARADMAARMGDRDTAIRMLGSVVDVRPGDVKAQQRLARLEAWAGRPALGCRYTVALAQLTSKEARSVADAVRCSREAGEGYLFDDLLTLAAAPLRSRAEELLRQAAKDGGLAGDLRLEATWSSGPDLDLALLDSDGNRISWLGAPTRAVISASSVTSPSSEGLALRGAKPGEYVVEIVRAAGTGSVSGELKLTVANTTRTVPFTLDGTRITLGIAILRLEARLVEAY